MLLRRLIATYTYLAAAGAGPGASGAGPAGGVYPNPAKTQVATELPLPLSRQAATASVVDTLGHSLPLTDLPPGVYWLRLTTGRGWVRWLRNSLSSKRVE